MTEQDVEVAETQTQIEMLDTEKSQLVKGEVSHNFHMPRVGYYHADARNFFEHPYGFPQDGRYFINGAWNNELVPAMASASRPTPEALKKVDAALEEEQKSTASASGTSHHGFGMGNALMMYWLLAGNRGMFSPGAGFQRASGQADSWQRGVENQRGAVSRYAAANPGYQRMVAQSRATGTPIRAGQSVRGGFGSSPSRNSGRSTFGS